VRGGECKEGGISGTSEYVYLSMPIYLSIGLSICPSRVNPAIAAAATAVWVEGVLEREAVLKENTSSGLDQDRARLDLYTALLSPIWYGVWHTRGGGVGGEAYITQ